MTATAYLHPLIPTEVASDPIWFQCLDYYERVRIGRLKEERRRAAEARDTESHAKDSQCYWQRPQQAGKRFRMSVESLFARARTNYAKRGCRP